jgi:thiol-disulfide isomerase/thioredoxin
MGMAAGVLTACTSHTLPPSAPHGLLNEPLPQFERTTVNSGIVRTSDLRGRLVVVKFFAKYCEPCKHTLPALEKLHRRWRDAAFIGVAVDERRDDVLWLIAEYGLGFPVIHDASNSLSGRFRVGEMPATFVVDRAGSIRWFGGPNQAEDDLAHALRVLSRAEPA